MLGQESCRTKVSRVFRYFVPNFAPNFAPNCPRIFEDFPRFVSWETETRKNSPKISAIFLCKIPRQTRKKYSEKNIDKILLESRQSNSLGGTPKVTFQSLFESLGLSGPYRTMRAAMRCEWRCVLNTEMEMRCDGKMLAMRVLAAEILCAPTMRKH